MFRNWLIKTLIDKLFSLVLTYDIVYTRRDKWTKTV